MIRLLSILAVASMAATAAAQQLLPLPAWTSSFSVSTATRGLQFQTPVPITIVGLRVPDEQKHGKQNVVLYKLAAKAPAFPLTAMSTPLFVSIGQPSATTLQLSVGFQAGDWIGVLGGCGDTTIMHNSYGAAGPFGTTIQGQATTLWRFLTQTNIASTQGTAPYSSEDSGNVCRVEVYYTAVSISGIGPGTPGSKMNFALLSPNDAGKPYLCATSLGTGPIPIDTRKLNLSPDQMFGVSVSGVLPGLFVNYSGRLSATGTGGAAINIPNLGVLKGLKLYTAFVTIDNNAPSNIAGISNSFAFTIS